MPWAVQISDRCQGPLGAQLYRRKGNHHARERSAGEAPKLACLTMPMRRRSRWRLPCRTWTRRPWRSSQSTRHGEMHLHTAVFVGACAVVFRTPSVRLGRPCVPCLLLRVWLSGLRCVHKRVLAPGAAEIGACAAAGTPRPSSSLRAHTLSMVHPGRISTSTFGCEPAHSSWVRPERARWGLSARCGAVAAGGAVLEHDPGLGGRAVLVDERLGHV